MSAVSEGPPREFRIKGVLIPDPDDVEAIRPTHSLLEQNFYSPDPMVRSQDRVVVPDHDIADHFELFDPSQRIFIRDGQVLVEFGPEATSDLKTLGIDDIQRPISLGDFSYAVLDGYEGYNEYIERIGRHAVSALRSEIASTPFGSTSPRLVAAERRAYLDHTSDEERVLASAAGFIHRNPGEDPELLDKLGSHIMLESISANQSLEELFLRMDELTEECLAYYKKIKMDAGEDIDDNPDFTKFTSVLRAELEAIKLELQESKPE